jgi:hypothetical protein
LLEEFLKRGSGIIIAGVESNSPADIPLLGFLTYHGIGIPSCALSVGDPGQSDAKPLPDTSLGDLSLPGLARVFATVTSGDKDIDSVALDHLVATLRCHIMAMRAGANPYLDILAGASWAYLDRTGGSYIEGGDNVCPSLTHQIVSVLLAELMTRLPARAYDGMDRSLPFPGSCGDVSLDSFTINLATEHDGWYSTGLYLPAGRVATISCEGEYQTLGIQVGCHSECILMAQPPWKR